MVSLLRIWIMVTCLSRYSCCMPFGSGFSSEDGSGDDVTPENNTLLEPTLIVDDLDRFCLAQRGVAIWNRTLELDCCQAVHHNFSRQWYRGRALLTEYLETLERWNCPQFLSECANKTFAFTDFTRMVYQRACSPHSFRQNCSDAVHQFVNKGRSPNGSQPHVATNWTNAIALLKSHSTGSFDSIPACVQVAMYDAAQPYDQYHEMVTVNLPFCGIVWCGVDAKTAANDGASLWNCMPRSCRTSYIVSISVIALIALVTMFANGCVVAIFCRHKNLRNSQGIYKLSLGIADCLVGLVVLPTFCYSLYVIAQQKHRVEMSSSSGNGSLMTYVFHTRLQPLFDYRYLYFVGYNTSLSLSISIYTLLLAGVDRLSLVRKPLEYNAENAKKFAIKAVIAIWLLAAVCSTLPFYVKTLSYGVIAGVLVSSNGASALYIYLFSFCLPLLAMWGVTIATCCYTFCHAREREATEFATELKLSRLLFTMVLVFTFGIAPVFGAVLGSFMLPRIYFDVPATLDVGAATAYVTFEFIAVVLLVCNSSWNFFIYNARNESFRKSTRTMFTEITDVGRAVSRSWKTDGSHSVTSGN